MCLWWRGFLVRVVDDGGNGCEVLPTCLCGRLVNHPHARTDALVHRDIQHHYEKKKKKKTHAGNIEASHAVQMRPC
jgi:hypothetical protein